MNDPIIGRKKVREALAVAPRRAGGRRSLSEEMLKTSVERLLGGTCTVPEFQGWLEWNHARNLIEFNYDADAEANFWELTMKGREKEGVA